MKSRIVFLIVLVIIFNFSALGKEPEWFTKFKQIQVLKSTREDVEKMFGFPKVIQVRKGKWSQTIDYEFNGGRFEVSYSTGKCSQETNQNGYNVNTGVVVKTYLFLFLPVKISELKLKLKGFEKYKSSEYNGLVYTNDEIGVQYSGDKKTISDITFYPSDKQDNLDCKTILK